MGHNIDWSSHNFKPFLAENSGLKACPVCDHLEEPCMYVDKKKTALLFLSAPEASQKFKLKFASCAFVAPEFDAGSENAGESFVWSTLHPGQTRKFIQASKIRACLACL